MVGIFIALTPKPGQSDVVWGRKPTPPYTGGAASGTTTPDVPGEGGGGGLGAGEGDLVGLVAEGGEQADVVVEVGPVADGAPGPRGVLHSLDGSGEVKNEA